METLVNRLYVPRVSSARDEFGQSAAIQSLLERPIENDALALFLIHFSALGVGMTRPVDGWIRRAGERCIELGWPDLGRALVSHAKHEAGHHEMMISDTRVLVGRWNASHGEVERLDAEALIGQAPTAGVKRYAKLHENVIASASPYGQLAIEYEIERLSVTFGPKLLGRCAKLLGPESLKGLSFLEDHVALDQGHTVFNERQLEKVLEAHPEFVDELAKSGAEALASYGEFVADCFSAASAQRHSYTNSEKGSPSSTLRV